jgi:hypothetical protein
MGAPETSPEAQAAARVLLAVRSSRFRRVPASAGAFFVYNGDPGHGQTLVSHGYH